MKSLTGMAALGAALFAVAAPGTASAQSSYSRIEPQVRQAEAQLEAAMRRFDAEYDALQRAFDAYRRARPTGDWRDRNSTDNRYDPRYDNRNDDYDDDPNYDPARDYRSGPSYQERVLSQNDRVYRGNDGRYYCRRSDGTTGLIVGAAAGGLFGNVIAGRRSSTVGTLLGAIAGGAAGSAIDRNQQQVRCR